MFCISTTINVKSILQFCVIIISFFNLWILNVGIIELNSRGKTFSTLRCRACYSCIICHNKIILLICLDSWSTSCTCCGGAHTRISICNRNSWSYLLIIISRLAWNLILNIKLHWLIKIISYVFIKMLWSFLFNLVSNLVFWWANKVTNNSLPKVLIKLKRLIYFVI